MSKPDLAAIVELHFDVLENSMVDTFHGVKCANLTSETDYCNEITDGANLCAEAHSASWWPFVACMYSGADPHGDKDHDAANPLAHVETFKTQLAKCHTAASMKDYPLADLEACTFGSDAGSFRRVSAAKTPLAKFRGPQWVFVAGTMIAAPAKPELSRDQWKEQLVSAVCSAHKGDKPESCNKAPVTV